jgi:hypothetical protein
MIKRAMNEVLGCGLSKRWLDSEPAAPVRCGQGERPLLNEWPDQVDIEGAVPL